MIQLPSSLLTILFLTIPLSALSYASPQPALVSDAYLHLMPRNTLFFRQVSTNDLQTFTGALGGFAASPITNSGDEKRPFQVGDSTFTDFKSAARRSCDDQFNECSQQANEEQNKADLTVEGCDEQKDECVNTQDNASVQDFRTTAVASENIGPDPDFPDFDLICEA